MTNDHESDKDEDEGAEIKMERRKKDKENESKKNAREVRECKGKQIRIGIHEGKYKTIEETGRNN